MLQIVYKTWNVNLENDSTTAFREIGISLKTGSGWHADTKAAGARSMKLRVGSDAGWAVEMVDR